MKHTIEWRSMDSAPKDVLMLLKSHTGRIGAGYVGIGTAMHLFENPIGWLPMPTDDGFEVDIERSFCSRKELVDMLNMLCDHIGMGFVGQDEFIYDLIKNYFDPPVKQ